ncbi:baculoviral IAP repeat-containing protein 3-like [Paramacrobiotus metropolitanus]|uniref:baculoviral IAP repeat-containing protein 3-like n=1 Tax=Paramacrobiotus metropolitanus TaxID=2943436 RepID=UPI0024463D01|nr:baculoviral IAP repeat-containing protein 3-like [Paramacrobiotus metropolitanus]
MCKTVLGGWSIGDNPAHDHKLLCEECPYAAMVEDGDYYVPSMTNYRDRFATFAEWPESYSQTPKQMALAGFYYLGITDRVQCFCCGKKLEKWKPQEDAWTEHAKWNPTCRFLIEQKGQAFINDVQRFYRLDLSMIVFGTEDDEHEEFIVASALQQGHSYMHIIQALQARNKPPGKRFNSVAELVQAVKDIQNRETGNAPDDESQMDHEYADLLKTELCQPAKMSERVKALAPLVITLQSLKPKQRKVLMGYLSKSQLKAMEEVAVNIVKNTVELSPAHLDKCKRHRKALKLIALRRYPLKEKRKILQRGGFIGAILPVIAGVLTSLIGNG